MKLSAAGLALIEEFEGLRLESYQDGAGIWTIGYGTTRHDGLPVEEGEACTPQMAVQWLSEDVSEAEESVNELVTVPVSQNQFDALVSFTYNLGRGSLAGSTLLKNLNSDSFELAAAQFPKWCFVAGKESPGLLRRRVAEQSMFTRA